MAGKLEKVRIRVGVALRQNGVAIALVAAWIGGNAAAFRALFGLEWMDAVLAAVCCEKGPGPWGGVYQSFTQVVVFGILASIVVANVTSKYRPESTCRALAARSEDHVVIVGLSHLGQRFQAMLEQLGKRVVVVEENRDLIAPLIADERPLVVARGRDARDLEDAGVRRAKVVLIAHDDVETVAIASRLVREANPGCTLIVRCPDDDVGELLAKTYRATVVSTSKGFARFVDEARRKQRLRTALVFGDNNAGRRAAAELDCPVVPVTDDPKKLAAAGVEAADLIVIADDDLGKNLLRVDRIRDLTKHARIVCRAFHETAAQVLTLPPFKCTVVSTSRLAAEALVREGALRAVGVEVAPTSPRPFDASPRAAAPQPTP